ncbi:hypothetical protein T265_02646 [Opisthorchis viverrini]|uniref:Uncharacterized protein n=1 Tax=Opisthorchis viverrini TaxID=6198 RepID=A0A075A642_OPIVI|nr:hypothetical protein T265_02646 [Opisthorchis viverrini]KER31085.1 hypothetical protein T265_02646 [Opisthorchis viverrini]
MEEAQKAGNSRRLFQLIRIVVHEKDQPPATKNWCVQSSHMKRSEVVRKMRVQLHNSTEESQTPAATSRSQHPLVVGRLVELRCKDFPRAGPVHLRRAPYGLIQGRLCSALEEGLQRRQLTPVSSPASYVDIRLWSNA